MGQGLVGFAFFSLIFFALYEQSGYSKLKYSIYKIGFRLIKLERNVSRAQVPLRDKGKTANTYFKVENDKILFRYNYRVFSVKSPMPLKGIAEFIDGRLIISGRSFVFTTIIFFLFMSFLSFFIFISLFVIDNQRDTYKAVGVAGFFTFIITSFYYLSFLFEKKRFAICVQEIEEFASTGKITPIKNSGFERKAFIILLIFILFVMLLVNTIGLFLEKT